MSSAENRTDEVKKGIVKSFNDDGWDTKETDTGTIIVTKPIDEIQKKGESIRDIIERATVQNMNQERNE